MSKSRANKIKENQMSNKVNKINKEERMLRSKLVTLINDRVNQSCKHIDSSRWIKVSDAIEMMLEDDEVFKVISDIRRVK